MKVVYSSVNLVSFRQLKYLLLLPFLVALAFGSDELGQSAGTQQTTSMREADFQRMKREVLAVLRAERPQTTTTTGGAVYIRWGRNVCATGSEAVYKGVAGGSWYDQSGGGSNYLCLPLQPIWGAYNERVEKSSKVYGSEYENPTSFGLNNNHYLPLHNNNVPCVVCRSQAKTSVVMTPARNQCYSGWYTEYIGYLMSASSFHNGRTEFICMDGQPESDPNGYRDDGGALFYNVEGVCGSLPCPPYAPRREVTCVVCSK